MAQYQHLPIYKATYDLLLRIMQLTKTFSREYKHTLGEKIQNEATEVVICIYKANNSENKIDNIKSILEHIQLVGLFLRISHDLNILPRDNYAQVVEKLDEIARQANGWLINSGKKPELAQTKV